MRTKCERCGADLDAADYVVCALCRRRGQRPLGMLLATIAAASLVTAAAQVAQLGCCGDNATPPAPDAGECLRWSPTICTPAGCCVDAGAP